MIQYISLQLQTIQLSLFHKVVVLILLTISSSNLFAQTLTGPENVTVFEEVEYVYANDNIQEGLSWSVSGGQVINYWVNSIYNRVIVRWNQVGTGYVSMGGLTLTVDVANLPSPPPSPIVQNALLINGSYFTAAWGYIPGATSYRLDVATSPSFSGGTILSSYNNIMVTANNHQVSGLSMATTYYYRVRAENEFGSSSSSSTMSVTTLCIPPTPANAGNDQTSSATCGLTSVTISANTPTFGSYVWSVISGVGGVIANPNSPSTTFSGAAGTTYVLRWTTSSSCASSTDDVVIQFNRNPTQASAGPDQVNLCGVTNTVITANAPTTGNGQWSILSGLGGSISNPGASTTTFSGIPDQIYSLRWTITNSPCLSSYDDVTILFNQIPTTATAGANQTICVTGTAALAANTPSVGTGQWSVSGGPSLSTNQIEGGLNNPFAVFRPGGGSGTYTLTWSIINYPCQSSAANVFIQVTEPPSTANAGVDITGNSTCGLTQVTLAAVSPAVGTGSWSVVSGSGGAFANATASNTTFSGLPGSYYTLRWTVSNGSCSSNSDLVTIGFNQYPSTAQAGSDFELCGQDVFQLQASTPTIGSGSWSLIEGSGNINDPTNPSSQFEGVYGESYLLRWTTSTLCGSSTDDVAISLPLMPTLANAGEDQSLSGCETVEFRLNGNSPVIGSGQWSVISGVGGVFQNSADPYSYFTAPAGNEYELRWTISNGNCSSSDEVTLTAVQNEPSPYGHGPLGSSVVEVGSTHIYTYNDDGQQNITWTATMASPTSGSGYNAALYFNSGAGLSVVTFRNNGQVLGSLCITVLATPPPTPTSSVTQLQNCGNTLVSRTQDLPADANYDWWWQLLPTGVSTDLGFSSSLSRTTSGDLWLRARLKHPPFTWSAASHHVGYVTVYTSPPSVPTVANNQTRFGTGPVTVSVGEVAGALSYSWYTTPSGGSPINGQTTRLFTTPVLTSSATTYYVSSKNGCESATRLPVTGYVLPPPSITSSGPNGRSIAMGQPVTLQATASYTTYSWRNSSDQEIGSTPTVSVDTPDEYKLIVTMDGVINSGSSLSFNVVRGVAGLNMNYVLTNTPTVDNIVNAEEIDLLPAESNLQQIQYFDGLGRALQIISTQGSPTKRDIVQPIDYDAFGREARKYLPYSEGMNGWYKPEALTVQASFYSGDVAAIPVDPTPYSQTIFEPSPLNRVIKQGAPGLAWQPNTDHTYNAADHTVKYSYEFNQANEVLRWTFTYPTEEYTSTAINAFGKVEAGTTVTPVFYPANQLYRNKTKDEQGNQVIEYVDKEGRTLLKRVQVVTGNPSTTDTNRDTNWASTYYIYDDFGNLVCVIPPEPSKRLTTQYFQAGSTETTKNNFLKRWAFRYRYDGRKRMIMKQVPGAEPVYMVYDERDRLVMTQDGNQRNSRLWSFTKYDQLNRPIATGIKDTSAWLTQGQMQTVVNTYYNDLATTKPWRKFGERYIGEGAPNTVHGYTNLSYPQTTTSSLNNPEHYLTVTYYDRYDFKSTWGGEYDYLNRELSSTVNGVLYNQPQQASNRVVGQVTGSKTKVLDGDFIGATSTGVRGSFSWIRSINYFDDKYRLIQNIQENYKGGTDRMSSLYDFSGKILRTENIHETYDLKWGKLTKTFLLGNKLCSTADFTTQWGVSGTYSADVLPAGTNGWLQWKAFQTHGGIVIGLSDQEVDVDYASIDYGIYMVGGAVLRVYESGAIKYSQVNGFKIGDVLRIERNGSTITYLKNGVVFYTSTVPSTSQLLTDVAYLAPNILAYDIKSSFSYRKQTTFRRFDYDHAGRLINTWHSFNNQPEILLAHNEYNELGQLIDKKLHSTVADASNAKQSVDYAYNIRGWLTHINDAALTTQAGENKDYFGMELAYNTDLGTGNPSDKLQFNGNINAMKWSNNQGLGDQKENAYNFTYDPLNRLITADFRQKDVSNWGLAKHRAVNGTIQSVDAFKEHISSYDLNGNIMQLQRSGQDGGLIDDLVYSYGTNPSSQSNRLLRVGDAANDQEGFKEINTTIDDYLYDNNGNLIQDRNKPSEEAVRNGSFDKGSDQWQLTEPGRLTFANGRVTITAGTSIALIDQNTPLRTSTPYLVFIEMVRTSATGTVKVLAGSNTGAIYSATGNGYATTGSLDRVGLEISPDFEGYIESISVRAFALITYNYLNLPERVIKGEGESMQYIYTATGQKLAQVVTEGTKTKTTDYVGEYVYENDTLLFVNHEEGRLSLSSGASLCTQVLKNGYLRLM